MPSTRALWGVRSMLPTMRTTSRTSGTSRMKSRTRSRAKQDEEQGEQDEDVGYRTYAPTIVIMTLVLTCKHVRLPPATTGDGATTATQLKHRWYIWPMYHQCSRCYGTTIKPCCRRQQPIRVSQARTQGVVGQMMDSPTRWQGLLRT
jgi:hypothetical protein